MQAREALLKYYVSKEDQLASIEYGMKSKTCTSREPEPSSYRAPATTSTLLCERASISRHLPFRIPHQISVEGASERRRRWPLSAFHLAPSPSLPPRSPPPRLLLQAQLARSLRRRHYDWFSVVFSPKSFAVRTHRL